MNSLHDLIYAVMVCIAAIIVIFCSIILVFHPGYKTRIGGTAALGILAMTAAGRISEYMDMMLNDLPIYVSKVALLGWVGLAWFLSWLFTRFIWRWKTRRRWTP